MAEPLARELWDLPAVTPERDDDVVPPPAATPGLSPWPFVLVGVGGAALIGGAVALGLGFSDRDAYAAAPQPTNDTEADALAARLSRAQTELLAGSVLCIGGGVIASVGIGWALGAGRDDGSSPLAVLPIVSPDGVGLVVAGSLPGGSL